MKPILVAPLVALAIALRPSVKDDEYLIAPGKGISKPPGCCWKRERT